MYVYIHIYIYTYTYIYICVYIHIYIYIHKYVCSLCIYQAGYPANYPQIIVDELAHFQVIDRLDMSELVDRPATGRVRERTS